MMTNFTHIFCVRVMMHSCSRKTCVRACVSLVNLFP